MPTTTIRQVTDKHGRARLTVHQRDDGLFFYTEDVLEAWDGTPAIWREGYPPSGLFALAEEAMAEALTVVPWLRRDRS